jgi:hypothetical protein
LAAIQKNIELKRIISPQRLREHRGNNLRRGIFFNLPGGTGKLKASTFAG